MSAEFVPLADLLRPRDEPPTAQEREPAVSLVTPQPQTAGDVAPEIVDALREARLFRARLADAFDEARAQLLRELAASVLARELRLAPCDLEAIVRRIAARAPVVRVRTAPGIHPAIAGVATLEDPQLCDGDAVVELAAGAIDARLGVRLAAVLEAFA